VSHRGGTVEHVLDEAVGDGVLPGVVAAVAGPDGIRDIGAVGRLRIDDERPVAADTVFRLMSLTKALTSVAALQLIEQDRLALDTPVADVLPQFDRLAVLDGFDGDAPVLRPPTGRATIRQLLSHTSGLAYGFTVPDLLRYLDVTQTPDAITGRRAALTIPLVADPGTAWSYGVSTDWLGWVIEAVSGQDLPAYLRDRVLDPLGMADTTFAPTAEQRARMMPVHRRLPGGGLAVTDRDPLPADPQFASGGHGAYGTVPDYARLLAALLGGGSLDGVRVLRAETVALAFRDHLAGLPLPAVMRSTMPELANDVPAPPFRQGWGLGFHLTLEDVPGARRAGTGDWSGLMNCFYWVDRRSGVAGIWCTQLLPFFDAEVVTAIARFEEAAYRRVS
jgi:CubicO group peptidase (beta-lactamase class C family)